MTTERVRELERWIAEIAPFGVWHLLGTNRWGVEEYETGTNISGFERFSPHQAAEALAQEPRDCPNDCEEVPAEPGRGYLDEDGEFVPCHRCTNGVLDEHADLRKLVVDLLRQRVAGCETCGGRGLVRSGDGYRGDRDRSFPCPSCPPRRLIDSLPP